MPRHYRITAADALSAHKRALELGGRRGLLNYNSVISAISRPYDGYHRPIHWKAAVLVHSIICNHGFADGNKRTATILLDLLLTRSGYKLRPAPGEDLQEALEQLIVNVAVGRSDHRDLARWFKRRIRKA